MIQLRVLHAAFDVRNRALFIRHHQKKKRNMIQHPPLHLLRYTYSLCHVAVGQGLEKSQLMIVRRPNSVPGSLLAIDWQRSPLASKANPCHEEVLNIATCSKEAGDTRSITSLSTLYMLAVLLSIGQVKLGRSCR